MNSFNTSNWVSYYLHSARFTFSGSCLQPAKKQFEKFPFEVPGDDTKFYKNIIAPQINPPKTGVAFEASVLNRKTAL